MKKFKSSFKVYYEDTDAGGVVYYANYLKFIERARTDAMASIDFTNSNLRENYGIYIIVKSCTFLNLHVKRYFQYNCVCSSNPGGQ